MFQKFSIKILFANKKILFTAVVDQTTGKQLLKSYFPWEIYEKIEGNF